MNADLAEAFDAFRLALQVALQSHAERSIATEIERLSAEQGARGFRLLSASVNVEVGELAVATASTRSTAVRRSSQRRSAGRRAPSKKGEAAPRSRKRGVVGDAVIAAFEDAGGELSVAQLHERLRRKGVETTANNLHQQMRRLVEAGVLRRAGRGVYSRTA